MLLTDRRLRDSTFIYNSNNKLLLYKMKQNLFINISDFDLNTLKIHEPYDSDENIIKIDLSRDNLKSILLYVDYHPVLSFNEKSCIINLKNSPNIKKKLEDIDALIVSELQQRKIIKKLKKKFSYKQMVSTVAISEEDNLDVLNMFVNMNDDKFKTKIYLNNLKELHYDDALNQMKNNCLIKFIIELTSVVIDKNQNLIYVDNVIRQIKIKKIKPKRIESLQYSFIDSEHSDSEHSYPEQDLDINQKSHLKSEESLKINENNTNDHDIVRNILDYVHETVDDNLTSDCNSYDENSNENESDLDSN